MSGHPSPSIPSTPTATVAFACGLQNIQKWCDGEPLNGRVRAEDEFDALDDADDEDFPRLRAARINKPPVAIPAGGKSM